MRELSTAKAVIDELGGIHAVASIVGAKYRTAWRWIQDGFPADTYTAIMSVLHERGCTAPDSLWDMRERQDIAS